MLFIPRLLLDLYSLVLFIAVVLSWVNLPPDNPFLRLVQRLTEPVLTPLRRVLPEKFASRCARFESLCPNRLPAVQRTGRD